MVRTRASHHHVVREISELETAVNSLREAANHDEVDDGPLEKVANDHLVDDDDEDSKELPPMNGEKKTKKRSLQCAHGLTDP